MSNRTPRIFTTEFKERAVLAIPGTLYLIDRANFAHSLARATSGIGLLATFAYDDLGRRTSLTRGNGTSTTYGFDAVSRLSSLSHDLSGTGTTYDQALGFSHNPAGQITSSTRSNDLYAWTGAFTTSTAITPPNGL